MNCLLEEEQLELYDRYYPGSGLKRYVESGGSNILIPLLGADYDSGLELLGKAGIGVIADNYYRVDELIGLASRPAKNLEERFGVPAKVLRKVQEYTLLERRLFLTLELVYRHAPEFLDVEVITHCLAAFLERNVLPDLVQRETDIEGYSELSHEKKLRIMRYLAGFEELDIYITYRDYLNMCAGAAEIDYTPEDLDEAHDRMMVDYLIAVPQSSLDLHRESDVLHHCVKSYVDAVANGKTRILFLRKRTEPETPFVTIEVENSVLIQCKAAYNRPAPTEAQAFVKKWAHHKAIKIRTEDITI